jgi:hypothetical protein
MLYNYSNKQIINIYKSALTREEAIEHITPWLVDMAGNKIYVTTE